MEILDHRDKLVMEMNIPPWLWRVARWEEAAVAVGCRLQDRRVFQGLKVDLANS